MAIVTCLFFIGLVYQTTRYSALKAELIALDRTEMELIKTSKELDANIAKLSNMERIEKAALQNGMQIALPEQRIVVTDIQPANTKKEESNGNE
jgi:cell division protein FtsL